MFGISFSEIIFILIIALIVLGPKQLAQVLSKFWLSIAALRHYLDTAKHDLYAKSGLNDLKNLHYETLHSYKDLKNNILNNISLKDKMDSSQCLEDNPLAFEEDIFYQPELDFEREPELFDEIYH